MKKKKVKDKNKLNKEYAALSDAYAILNSLAVITDIQWQYTELEDEKLYKARHILLGAAEHINKQLCEIIRQL